MTSKMTRNVHTELCLFPCVHQPVCTPFPGESQQGGLKHLSRPGFPLPQGFDERLST